MVIVSWREVGGCRVVEVWSRCQRACGASVGDQIVHWRTSSGIDVETD